MAAYIGGRPPKGQWPVDHRAGRFLKLRRRIFDATDWRDDMRAGRWIAAIAGCVFAAAAVPTTGAIMLDDPYAWLEDVHGERPLDWVRAQNRKALAVLKEDPRYQAHFDSILAILDASDRIPFGSLDHRYVFNFWQDAAHPKGLWRRTTIADYAKPSPEWDVLIDVDRLAADEHENWVWKGAECSPSLARCLVSLSRGGGDAVVVREFEVPTKRFVASGFALAEAKSFATWNDDDSVFFGTDFGKGSLTTSGYPRIVKLWRRGQPVDAAPTVYEGKLDDVLAQVNVIVDGKQRVPVVARAVSFFETEYFLSQPGGKLVPLPLPRSAILQAIHHGQVLVTLRTDWTTPDGTAIPKGALFAFALADVVKSGKLPKVAMLYVPDARGSIDQVASGQDAVYASIFENVIGAIHEFRFDGKWSDKPMSLPQGGSTHIVSTNDYGPEAYFTFESFLTPTTLFAGNGRSTSLAIKSLPARFDATGLESEQFEAASADGTKIPYFVVRASHRSAPAATVLYGYGGFEIALTPSYSANFGKLWVTRGGVYVVANIRGGGEFGPGWHEAALQANRQRAFDDFAAVAADLVRRGITTAKQLAIMGGSNGGLLVSTVMTQHPELLGAVVCQVPLIDMIAYTHIGAGASWIGEYGDPADPKAREWILKYSPYQNVRARTKYPPVFFVTATSDDRVTPVHARKMAARMEEQGHDVLYYENTDGGHAAAADHKQAAEMWALSFVYLKRMLGLAD
jgi:prolyl oligopeptidase